MRRGVRSGPAVAAPVGRDSEVHQVLEAARRACAGHGGVVLISGEAGIGKTTLVRALEPELAGLGMQVCRGAADLLETALPFSAIGDCLDRGRRSAAARQQAAVAEQGRTGPGDRAGPPVMGDEMALLQQVIAVVEDLCEDGAIALVLDDAQWADPQSLLCLQRISRLVEQLPLLVLLAIRSGESTPQLDQLTARLSQRGAATITLRPLSEHDVEKLLTQLTGAAAAGPALRRLAADAAGNPFYVAELVEALNAAGRLTIGHDTAGHDTAEVETEARAAGAPESLHAVIMRRLVFLPAEVTEVLRTAALLGSRFGVDELAAATSLPPQQLYQQLELAERAGVMVETEEQLTFRHDLVRQALEQTMSVSARQAMHKQLGLALAAAGQPVVRVADQLRRSGGTLGPAGLDWLDGAADRLVARDRDGAVELLQRGLADADPADARAQRLRVVLARALEYQGRIEECRQVVSQALAGTDDPELRTELRWVLVKVAAAGDRAGMTTTHEYVRLAQEAASHPDTSPEQRQRFLAWYATRLCNLGEVERGREVAEAVRTSGAADASAVSQALVALALADLITHRPGAAWKLLEQAHGHAAALDIFRSSALLDLGRFDEAVAAVRQPSEEAGGAKSAGDMLWGHLYRAYVRFIGGWWDDAGAEIEAGREVAEYSDVGRGLYGLGALLALHRGEVPTAETYLARAPVRSPSTPGDAFIGSFPRWAHARYEQYRGHPEQALEMLEQLCRHDCGNLPALWLTTLAPEVVRLAIEQGQTNRAHGILELVSERAEHAEPGLLESGLRSCQGLLERDAEALRAAAERCGALHRTWQRARCYEDAAGVWAERGEREEALHDLEEAIVGYQELEAAWDLSRAESSLRALGARRGVRGRRRRPTHGWDALTVTERKVADLVAEGLSNPHIAQRLFVSRSTVQTHVSSVLSKLGLTSRVEVAINRARHGER
ncbi:AAA family ATPase [Streptomyces sp. NPDC086554]|uniref:helix-turn-helix transcriptional regulator n=1 Tax=Streptomyces sp. NPDC086554 TaxID=3154864 RepID=UPI00342E8ABE